MIAANPETPILLSSIPFSSMTRRTARERSASLLKEKNSDSIIKSSTWNKFQKVNRIRVQFLMFIALKKIALRQIARKLQTCQLSSPAVLNHVERVWSNLHTGREG